MERKRYEELCFKYKVELKKKNSRNLPISPSQSQGDLVRLYNQLEHNKEALCKTEQKILDLIKE